ncbi:sulfotransferase [Jannaschia sp. LMIT008]|uniref:sulfotransferase n=1 Tax=Jannaschia maritima TaxID=3032585 RepID=UPI0028122BFE|nr:sulfotransferase [Jannaschia sp. LMIT008]
MPDVVLISGNGRSGSNRLLDMFDESDRTVCRSEVNAIGAGDFVGIGGTLFADDAPPDLSDRLRRAIARARRRRSERDHFDKLGKAFFRPAARAAVPLMARSRARRLAVRAGVMRDAAEWTLPPATFDRAALDAATLVLKINAAPVWARALLCDHPGARVVHNIREPRGYLASWYNRFLKGGAQTADFRSNFADVPRILSHFGRPAAAADDLREPTLPNMVEVEVWRWRHINELHQTLPGGPDRVCRIGYGTIDADPRAAARMLYGFAGLPLGPATEEAIAGMRNTLFAKKHADALDPAIVDAALRRVLSDSPLREIPEVRAALA